MHNFTITMAFLLHGSKFSNNIVREKMLKLYQTKKGHITNNIWHKIKRAYPVQRAPALCGVWGMVLVASLTLACAMRGDHDSNLGPSGHRRDDLK